MQYDPQAPLWRALSIPNSLISTRLAGDLGPSGWDEGAVIRRSQAYAAIKINDLGARLPCTENSLICHQTHSLRIIVLLQSQAAIALSGHWDQTQSLNLSTELLPLPPGTSGWEALRTTLPEWVGGLDADGLITDDPAYWLGVTVADCLPILMRAKKTDGREVRAALHSGWGGTGILAAAVTFLAQLGCGDLVIQMGPSIAACDYPVPPERAGIFAKRFGPESVITCADGQPGLDLQEANLALLTGRAPAVGRLIASNSGRTPWASLAAAARVHQISHSTTTLEWSYSYRRDGKQNYGRMLTMIGAQA